nr:nucleolin-like [Coffea arabica]
MVRIRGGSVSAGRTFKLRDEEDENVQVIELFIKSPKKKTKNRGEKTKQSARKKLNAQTREASVEPSEEQMEEHQSEGHPGSGNEEELGQPTNVDVTTTKSPRKGKRIAKRKSIAQPKGRQTVDPSGKQQDAEKNAEKQQTDEPSTKKSPTTRSGVQGADLLVPPIPPENENAHRKELRNEPTTEATPEYRIFSSQPQDKEKTPVTEEETEDDDDDEDEDTEEEDPAQFHLDKRRPGSCKITI